MKQCLIRMPIENSRHRDRAEINKRNLTNMMRKECRNASLPIETTTSMIVLEIVMILETNGARVCRNSLFFNRKKPTGHGWYR